MKPSLLIFVSLVGWPASILAESEPEVPAAGGHVFAWPFMSWQDMVPRGGSTTGTAVTLRTSPGERWQALHEDGLDARERDRRAILAMTGDFRVSFDFVETLGFRPDYRPPRPYFSWATEHVAVLEDREDFVSLQHSLVMYFKDEEGNESGPFVMKHWRQDWQWEAEEIHVYEGRATWRRVPAPEPAGRWSQAVYQVDDSPRYQVMGRWSHEGGMSVWRGDDSPRPLPRREFSVRDDYNVLEGTHEIVISPTGWLHVQHNRKLDLAEDGSKSYVGTELGVNRYEAITAPDLAGPASEAWEKTGDYWAAVRETWDELMGERERFSLRPELDGRRLFEIHFGHAAEVGEGADPEEMRAAARETIHGFVLPAEAAEAGGY